MKIAFATDLHLDHCFAVNPEAYEPFVQSVSTADILLLGGDTSHAQFLEEHLKRLYRDFGKPIYFVLGNHDFYGSGIQEVRRMCQRLILRSRQRTWYLPAMGWNRLYDNIALLGHDGWGDMRNGNLNTTVQLNDFHFIRDLSGISREHRMAILNNLGEEAAAHLREHLQYAFEYVDRAIIVTHAPPFAEVAMHRSGRTNTDYLPYYTCRAVGDTLREIMRENPTKSLVVLCGHTHTFCDVQILPNLRVITGGASYGLPLVTTVCDVEQLFT